MVWGAIAGGLATGLAGSLLGGGDSGTQKVENTPWNAAQLKELMDLAKTNYEQGPAQYYPGSTVAEMDPRMTEILNQMMGFSSNPMVSAGGDALMQALQGTQDLRGQVSNEQVQGTGDYASYLMNLAQGGGGGTVGGIAANADPTSAFQQFLGGSATNPYTDALVAQATNDLTQNLNENIMPRIDQGSLANNAYGGSRQGIAQGKAIEATSDAIGDASTNIRSTMANRDLDRQLSAANSMLGAAGQGDQYFQALQGLGLSGANLGRGLFQDLAGITGQQASMAPLLQSFQGMNLNTGLTGAQVNQNYLQSLLSDDVARWNFEQGADDQNLQQYANLLLGAGGLGSTQTMNTPQASIGERLLGGGLTGLGAYGALQKAGAGDTSSAFLASLLGGLGAGG